MHPVTRRDPKLVDANRATSVSSRNAPLTTLTKSGDRGFVMRRQPLAPELETDLIRHYARREASKLILSAVEEIRTVLNRLAENCHEVYDDASAHLEAAQGQHDYHHHHNGERS
jgi:hypothetical protein